MRDDRLVLCYHAVSADWPAATAVRPEDLARQVEILVRRGYEGTTFTRAVQDHGRRRLAAVTFDDAHLSVWDHARGILASHGWPGTVFVPTGYAGRDGLMLWSGNELWADTPWSGELRCMDWGQIATLAEEGWEIGSHTRTHPILPDVEDAPLAEELAASRMELEERLGRPCRSIAYPYGAVDARVTTAAGQAGYATGATTLGGGEDRPLDRRREVISRTDGIRRFSVKTLPSVRRLLAEPAVARLKARVQFDEVPA